MLRTVSYCLHGLVPASCICADRYDREAVVKALGDEAGLKPPLVLGQLSSTPDELLKLDQVFIKTELKVGVILVREGQQTEEQILDNQSHTPLFDEFLSVLGDRIRLKGFDKYKGGLDSVHDLTGTESVYTAWRGIEIIFHVSTLLPHEEHDPQKLQKKRHIGNDIVCVAFLEADDTLFSPTCIKSHFLHTFIVVRSSPSNKTSPTSYEVSVVSRDEVGAYKPYLWHRSKFVKDSLFREWLLTKIVNGERASYSAPKFARMQDRTRSQMLEDIVTNLQNHVETGQIPKPYRRGSWRPIGHMRPSSPLLDSVRDTFEGFEQLARDFGRAFQNNRHLCDVIFNVGQGKEKTRVYAVRAILGVRSRVFLEMLYGFTTGYGPCMVAQGDPQRKDSLLGSIKSSNFLQVPPHDTVRSKTPTASPTVFRYFSRLGNWAGWGMGSRSKSPLTADAGLKRWQSEFDCKEKEKERRQSVAATEVTLSMCADAGKVDRAKLSQTEFNIIEFDSETFMILMEYLQSGSCPLTCETIPGLICAAEHYDLPELLQACFHHAKQHFRLSVVCSMLNMLENYYWRYNSASELVNAILQFIDSRAAQLFSRREFLDLSESMFQMILGRDLNISEVSKFQVMLQWANYKIEMSTNVDPRELECIMNRLTRDLKLQKIPPQELIRVILPTKTISNQRILETLLWQADTGMYRIQQSHIEECRARTRAENSESLSWDILETKICNPE
ncbi:Signal-induced proliferation-associated 1-like protein 1 [Araneus ventricosus]|uniref:Signal-induced proliferation-associated 1-like protein 1 n=1 Tax=Araneus ventricosus TaxID=182803 RepID=A0A4Y2A4Y6_ARAVE|nr:Signal-induced proliferation-associated 1-like protein 1 [Araneus ventricosus]